MGTDVDEVLAYQTPKVVKIKDRLLGVLKTIFVVCIFCYVVIFQLFYKGSHLRMESLSGVARVQLQHPTKLCNPMNVKCASNYTSMEKLPYCSQYKGGDASLVQRTCKYFDALDVLIPMDDGYLIPSFIQSYRQVQSCTPNAENHYRCKNKYTYLDSEGRKQKEPGRAKPVNETFVADIESFTLLIDHSFRITTGSVEYDDHKMQGYWLDCSHKQWTTNSTWLASAEECNKRPIICMHKDCKKLGLIVREEQEAASLLGMFGAHSKHVSARRKLRRSHYLGVGTGNLSQDTGRPKMQKKSAGDIYALAPGDVLSLRTLYAMAGRSLDDMWYDAEKEANVTTRQRGTVLVVDIHYSNMKPWTIFRPKDPPEYVISVSSQPVEKYKNMKAVESADSKDRELIVSYGTLVVVRSSGTIGVFSMINALIVVSTSLGLLAVASVITELLAFNVLPMREDYAKAKFEETEDFNAKRMKSDAESAEALTSEVGNRVDS
jgi:hypothetical protein